MKKMIFTISLTTAITFAAFSQWINQMYITPANPTICDNITFFYNASFPSMGCNLQFSEVLFSENTISINTLHEQGMLPTICTSTQFFPLGILAEGNYIVNLQISIPGNFTTGIFQFNVTGIVDLPDTEPGKFLQIFPNPVNDILNVETSDVFELIRMYDMTGRHVADFPFSDRIDMKNIPKGLYQLVFASDKQLICCKIVISR